MDEGLTEFVNEIVDNGLDGIQEDNAPPPPKKKIVYMEVTMVNCNCYPMALLYLSSRSHL